VRTGTLVVVLGLALLPLMPKQYWDRMATITASSEGRDESAASRLHFWRVAIRMANDHPLLGVGQIGFQPAYDRYDWTEGEYGRRRAVHSSWFGVLADQGYLGLTMFAALFVAAFHACSRARAITREVKDREALFTIATTLQTALAAAAVGGSFLSFHYIDMMWHLFGFSFALQRMSRSLVISPAVDATAARSLPQIPAGHVSPAAHAPIRA
jgi:O-antigen ligase